MGYKLPFRRGVKMTKINQEKYEALKDRISEEIYSWDGAESGWGDDAVENVLEILDDFFWETGHQARE